MCFFLVVFTLSCSKSNPPHTNVGVIYKPNSINDEVLKQEASDVDTSTLDLKEINNKLELMRNNDLFSFALDAGNQGKYREALAAYNKILERDKNYPDVYYYQGLLYRDMGMRDEAICAFRTAVIQNPNSAEAHYNLGYAYRCKGLHREAIAEYQKALELIPDNKTKQRTYIHYNLGFSYFSHGLVDDAINEFNNALAYKPKDKEIHQKLGIAYTAKGWTNKAKDEFSLYHKYDTSTNPIKK